MTGLGGAALGTVAVLTGPHLERRLYRYEGRFSGAVVAQRVRMRPNIPGMH